MGLFSRSFSPDQPFVGTLVARILQNMFDIAG